MAFTRVESLTSPLWGRMGESTQLMHFHTEIVIPLSAELFQGWRVPEPEHSTRPYTDSLSCTHKGIKFNL